MNTITPIRPQAMPAPQAAPAPAAEAPAPDLVVDSVVASNANPKPGASIWFDVTVSNRGDAPAGAFSVRVTSDKKLDQELRVQEGLAPGQSAKLAHVGPLKTDAFGGSLYWVTATVDSRDEVAERREDNNWLMTSITPQHPPTPPTPPPPPPIPWPPTTMLAE